MALKGLLRASMAQVRVLNIDDSVHFYRDVLGLVEVGRAGDKVFFKGYDEFDHHTFAIRKADKPGLDFLAFKVSDNGYLDAFEAKTKAFGLPIETIAPNSDQPGYGKRLAVSLPNGHRIDLFVDVEQAKQTPGLHNPEVLPNGKLPVGCGCIAFDHALLFGPNSAQTVKYFREVLEMGLVEVLKAPDGNGDICSWLTGSNRPHDVAVLEFEQPGKVHHFAFKLEDWNHIGRCADFLTMNDVVIDAGPMRHGITRGYTIYFFDPSGNRVETFAGGYAYYPDMPTRVWDFDQVGKGIFYYSRRLQDNYLTVVT
ncbi:MAG: catechol 2,3-dioxygenase [Erysipelotrichaceae bacterium]|jgi:catechol 2,3-dioxygenase|nr:catechol 2,3-dioxygenase [Erysipelotrichaceae bacterium]